MSLKEQKQLVIHLDVNRFRKTNDKTQELSQKEIQTKRTAEIYEKWHQKIKQKITQSKQNLVKPIRINTQPQDDQLKEIMSEVFKIKMVLNKKLNEVSEDEQEQF
ncbi:hypothetical protein pb186bvf_014897 [Paramecium bursaria]